MQLGKRFPYRLITFDVTNTLLNFKENVGATYSKVGLKFGVKCEPKQLSESFKNQFKKQSIEHPNFGLDKLKWEEWWKLIVTKTFRECCENDLSNWKLNSIYSELIELYKTSKCWEPAVGAIELLNYLKNSGVSLGVISNFDPRLHDILLNIRMNSYFNFVLTSYEAGAMKPDNRIFEKATEMSAIKNLEKNQCLHIGDTYNLDYVGATQYGWNSFLVVRKETTVIPSKLNKEHVFKNLSELHRHLESNT